jgi:hypothetical protein
MDDEGDQLRRLIKLVSQTLTSTSLYSSLVSKVFKFGNVLPPVTKTSNSSVVGRLGITV